MDKNISTLLREIKDASSWSEPRIASEIGTSQPTVNRILNGQNDCKGKTLQAIHALHKSLCPMAPACAPSGRRATDSTPSAGHAGRQPASSKNIADTLPGSPMKQPP